MFQKSSLSRTVACDLMVLTFIWIVRVDGVLNKIRSRKTNMTGTNINTNINTNTNTTTTGNVINENKDEKQAKKSIKKHKEITDYSSISFFPLDLLTLGLVLASQYSQRKNETNINEQTTTTTKNNVILKLSGLNTSPPKPGGAEKVEEKNKGTTANENETQTKPQQQPKSIYYGKTNKPVCICLFVYVCVVFYEYEIQQIISAK
jgi:cell division septation protein DedD